MFWLLVATDKQPYIQTNIFFRLKEDLKNIQRIGIYQTGGGQKGKNKSFMIISILLKLIVQTPRLSNHGYMLKITTYL